MVIQQSHLRDMLSHRGPLGLANRLLNVEPLPFCCVSTEDCELMQLNTVLEGLPHSWMPSFGHLTVYSSPSVALVHLAANAFPLRLRIAGQEVSQMLVDFGNCLIMSLLEFLEQMLSLLNLNLAGLNINVCQDSVS